MKHNCIFFTQHIGLTLLAIISFTMISVKSFRSVLYHREIHTKFRQFSSKLDPPTVKHKRATFPLSLDERNLFESLRLFMLDLEHSTAVRVAGGWVRDKLLAIPGGNDIDIAVDSMTGLQFVELYNRWRDRHGEERQGYNIVKKNPEKSKHLETITVRYGDLDVDFVNLRTESYAENSRIPHMALGTPQEDALRRDLTINSLYFNIQTQEVEDYTGRGIDDLEKRIIRTPLPPLVTLMDDPLRALRAVRFACRFSFNMDSELLRACQEETVHEALHLKVSPSRISTELMGMMKTSEYFRSVFLLHRTRLLHSIIPFNSEILQDHSYQPISRTFSSSSSLPHYIQDRPADLIYDVALFSTLLQKCIVRLKSTTSPDNHNNSNAYSNLSDEFLPLETIAQNIDSHEELLRYTAYANIFLAVGPTFLNTTKHIWIAGIPKVIRDQLELPTKVVKDMIHVHTSLGPFKKMLLEYYNYHNDSSVVDVATKDSKSSKLLFEQETNATKLASSRHSEEIDTCTGRISRLSLGLAVHEAGVHFREILMVACVSTALEILVHKHFKDTGNNCTGNAGTNHKGVAFNKFSHKDVQEYIDGLAIHLQILDREKFFYSADDSIEQKTEIVLGILRDVVQSANYLLTLIDEWRLYDILRDPPVMKGDQMMEINPESKLKRYLVKEMVDIRIRWQICNPQGTADELAEYFKKVYNLSEVSLPDSYDN